MRAIATLLAMSLLATGLAGCVAPDELDGPGPDRQAPGAIDFQTLDQGQSSAIQEQRTVLVTDQTAWSQLWAEHTANRGDDAAERPQVDFETQRVAAAFRGQAPNACHGAEVQTVRYDQANETVQVEVAWVETTGVACAEVLTYPYHIVVFNATAEEAAFATRDVQRPAGSEQDPAPDQNDTNMSETNSSRPTIPFETVDRGSNSGIEERQEVVVRDNETWQALWANHTQRRSEPEPAPQVNFSEQMVLAVFKGQSPDGCHGTEIERALVLENGTLLVEGAYYKVEGTACTLQITYPFHMVELDRRAGEVRFGMDEETRQAD